MDRFGSIDAMQMLLVGILLLCGYIYLFQTAAKHSASRASIPLLAIVLLAVYLMIFVPLVMILSQMGGLSFVFLALLILGACVGLITGIYGLFKYFRQLNKTMLLLFILYVLMLSYITVFSRKGRVQTDILLNFNGIKEALRRHSLEPIQHLWANILLFVPIGLFFAGINPPRLARLGTIFSLGLLLTTAIETTQMLLQIGQCDLEDLLANTLGACIGLLVYRIYHRLTLGQDREYSD